MSREIDRSSVSAASSGAVAARTALTPLVWGTTYIVATEFLPEGRPMLAACVRALPIGLVFVVRSRILPSGAWWWRSLVLGVLNIGAFFALLFVAAFRLPGGVAATAGALQPLVAAGLAAVVLGEVFTRRTAVAGAAGVVGVAMLVLGPDAALDPIGIAAAIGGTVSMAMGVVLTKHWGRPVDLITFTGWQLTAGGLVLLPIVVLAEGFPSTLTAPNVAGFAWLAVVGTGAAYANWFAGVQRLPINVVSFLGLLSPVIATIAGWLVLGQSLSPVQLAGAILVLSAVIAPQLRTSQSHGQRRAGRADLPRLAAGRDDRPRYDEHRHSGWNSVGQRASTAADVPPNERSDTMTVTEPSPGPAQRGVMAPANEGPIPEGPVE